jgi:hypothetical protein
VTDNPIGWIREIVLNSPDPWRLAAFWAGLLGGTPVQWYPGWVTLEPPPRGQRFSIQGVDPDAEARSGSRADSIVHFDIMVADLVAAHDRVIAAGATYLAEHVSPRPDPSGEAVNWRVYHDPEGHPFCLVTR